MAWNLLLDKNQVQEILSASKEIPQLFFKHSTRCSISTMALRRFENSGILEEKYIQCWYLDLLENRQISAEIESLTQVTHQSPQAILVVNGEIVYSESHGMIDAEQIRKIVV
jgi:bacillithiol system protein YtxJ